MRLSKITVLGVCCPFQLLEGLVADPSGALFQPLHLVISESQGLTQVSVLSGAAVRASGVTPAGSIPLHRTIARVVQALDSTGARRTSPSRTLGEAPIVLDGSER